MKRISLKKQRALSEFGLRKCTQCGLELASVNFSKSSGRNICKSCRNERERKYASNNRIKSRNYRKSKRLERISNGVCSRCSYPSLGHVTVCLYHWLFIKAITNLDGNPTKNAELLEGKLVSQKYKCPYTNQLLIPGLNCWLDHIKPKRRFPELARNINNVEWVSKEINIAKSDKTKEEFIQLCNLVHQHTSVDIVD